MVIFRQVLGPEIVTDLNEMIDDLDPSAWFGQKDLPYSFTKLMTAGKGSQTSHLSGFDHALAVCIEHCPDDLQSLEAYIIRCPAGGCIEEHCDSVVRGERWRFNVLLSDPDETKASFLWHGDPVRVEAGDGMLFRADTNRHGVSKCEAERRVLSISCVV